MAYKSDFSNFLRKNFIKIILCAVIVAITLIVAIRNGIALEDYRNYFEKKNRIELQLLRGEKTIFSYLISRLIESAIIYILILICSFNDLTTLFTPVFLIYKAYKTLFIDIIILRFLGFCSILYFIFRLITLMIYEFILCCGCCALVNNYCRYCYGLGELKGAIKSLVPSIVGASLLIIVESVLVGVSLIFI